MKYLLIIPFFFLLTNCKQHKTNEEPVKKVILKHSEILSDELLIEKLLKDLYEWKETKSKLTDFNPLENQDSEFYRGLDLAKNKERIIELKNSNLFSDKFLENYENIAKSIDLSLKEKSFEWVKGELPPFGNGADLWCNCQDSPDKYWQTIKVKNLNIQGDIASFSWSFDNEPDYKIKAIKEKNVWKIMFLEGIDEETFLNID